MEVMATALPGVLLIRPRVFGDERGFFLETFSAERYRQAVGIEQPLVQDNHSRSRRGVLSYVRSHAEALGIEAAFVQDNQSRSSRGVLRGLHYQLPPHAQGKLVRCASGRVFDVAVDIDPASPTCGRHVGVELSDANHLQLWIPPGYAHGFCVLSEEADFVYKCTDYYHPEDEGGLAWNCPRLGIPWPIDAPLLSAKDAVAPLLADARHFD